MLGTVLRLQLICFWIFFCFRPPLNFGFVYSCTAIRFIAVNNVLKNSYGSGRLMLCCGWEDCWEDCRRVDLDEEPWNETVREVPVWGGNQWNWTRIRAFRWWEELKTTKGTENCGWQGAASQGDCWRGMKRGNWYQLQSGKWSLGSCTSVGEGFSETTGLWWGSFGEDASKLLE